MREKKEEDLVLRLTEWKSEVKKGERNRLRLMERTCKAVDGEFRNQEGGGESADCWVSPG